MSTDINDTGSIPVSPTPETPSADWEYDTLAQRFDTLPDAIKAHRVQALFMDAPPQEAEPAPVVVPVSYPSSDADSFFDRTWFETGAIDVSELREKLDPAPMRVEHVIVSPSVTDPIAASLAAEHGVEIPEPASQAQPAIDDRPVFERPLYEPVTYQTTVAEPIEYEPVIQQPPADDFFETAPVVGAAAHQDFAPAMFDRAEPVVDRTSDFESFYADSRVESAPAYSAPEYSAPDYSAETPGDAWYVEPPFVKGETIVPAGGTPSRLGRLLVPIALGAVAVMALIAGWTHFQNSGSDSTIVVAPTNQPAASTAPTVAPVVPTPAVSIVPTIPSAAPVDPTPGSSSAAPVIGTADRSVPVVVLNASGTKGLAAKVADELRAKGWTVLSIGNYASSAQTTVYSPGPRTASATMRSDVPQASLTHKPLPGMSKSHITLVLGTNYTA